MQIELSGNAIRFLNTVIPTVLLRPDNDNFLSDAQAIDEILKAVKPKEANATSNVQQ